MKIMTMKERQWLQYCSLFLFILQVQLEHDHISEYVIRTQPNSKSLCTIEAIALSLSVLENNNEIAEVSGLNQIFLFCFCFCFVCFFFVFCFHFCVFHLQVLIRPLRALCKFQLDHGAVVHSNKDHRDEILLRA